MSAIADAAQALAGLLRAAEEGGLPMPYHASAIDYAPSGHPDFEGERLNRGGISLGFDNLAQLAEWSTWLDEPIHDPVPPGRSHDVYGYAGPVPVNAWALVSTEAAS